MGCEKFAEAGRRNGRPIKWRSQITGRASAMSDDRFAPPTAEVLMPEVAADVPEAIRKKIRNAWMAGLASALVTLLFVLLAVSGTSLLGFGLAQLVDVALILGLSLGIFKKSRVCAVLMLLYFLYAKFQLLRFDGVGAANMVTALLFIYFYAGGVIGTYRYHKHVRRNAP
jgi:serine/threonine-protein kinase